MDIKRIKIIRNKNVPTTPYIGIRNNEIYIPDERYTDNNDLIDYIDKHINIVVTKEASNIKFFKPVKISYMEEILDDNKSKYYLLVDGEKILPEMCNFNDIPDIIYEEIELIKNRG